MELKLSEWLLKKMHEREDELGSRITVTEFAKYLGYSQATLSAWLNETRSPSYETALALADKLSDYSIMSILGYANPQLDSIPPEMRQVFDAVVEEISRVYADRGIDPVSAEAIEIAKAVFEGHGWIVTI